MPGTYNKIATTTVSGGSTNSIDFNSISGAYTDLVLVLSHAFASTSGLVYVNINNDSTNNNYSQQRITWDAGGYGGDHNGGANNVNQHFISWTRTNWGNTVVNFMNYSNTTTHKSVINRTSNSESNTAGQGSTSLFLWRNTAAINQITILNSSNINFTAGSKATLYGILKA